jgi:hypothetical protein
MIEIRQTKDRLRGDRFLHSLGIKAASSAADMPNTLCATCHRREQSLEDGRAQRRLCNHREGGPIATELQVLGDEGSAS